MDLLGGGRDEELGHVHAAATDELRREPGGVEGGIDGEGKGSVGHAAFYWRGLAIAPRTASSRKAWTAACLAGSARPHTNSQSRSVGSSKSQ